MPIICRLVEAKLTLVIQTTCPASSRWKGHSTWPVVLAAPPGTHKDVTIS